MIIFISKVFTKRNKINHRGGENMEKETLELINKKIRELIQDGNATSMVMALDLIEAINDKKQLSSKTFIDKLIDEASEKSNTSEF